MGGTEEEGTKDRARERAAGGRSTGTGRRGETGGGPGEGREEDPYTHLL